MVITGKWSRFLHRVVSSAAVLLTACRPSATRDDLDAIDLQPHAVIDLGSEQVREDLVEGFFAPEPQGRRNAAWSHGKTSRLSLRLKAERHAYVLAFLAEPYFKIQPVELAMALNGRPLGSKIIEAGWKAYRTAIDPSLLRDGSNELSFMYSRTARPADVDPSSQDVREISVRMDQVQLQPITDRVQLPFDMHDALSRSMLGEGWAIDDNDRYAGVWTLGARALVNVDLERQRSPTYRLSLTAQSQAGVPTQAVRILLNGTDLGELEFQTQRSMQSLAVNAAKLREHNEIALVFETLKAPAEINPKSRDQRLLGLRALELSLLPSSP